MKPFDLEKAKAGAPVCDRNGNPVRIICFDAKLGEYPIIALVEWREGKESIKQFGIDGHFLPGGREAEHDLMMVTEKKKGWMALFKMDGLPNNVLVTASNVYVSEEEVKKFLRDMRELCPAADLVLIEIRQIEWEE